MQYYRTYPRCELGFCRFNHAGGLVLRTEFICVIGGIFPIALCDRSSVKRIGARYLEARLLFENNVLSNRRNCIPSVFDRQIDVVA